MRSAAGSTFSWTCLRLRISHGFVSQLYWNISNYTPRQLERPMYTSALVPAPLLVRQCAPLVSAQPIGRGTSADPLLQTQDRPTKNCLMICFRLGCHNFPVVPRRNGKPRHKRPCPRGHTGHGDKSYLVFKCSASNDLGQCC